MRNREAVDACFGRFVIVVEGEVEEDVRLWILRKRVCVFFCIFFSLDRNGFCTVSIDVMYS